MKKIAVLTSGGDAPGMNAAVRAVVRRALSFNLEVYGIQNGYKGLLAHEFIKMEKSSVSNIIQTGGTFLRTARCLEFIKPEKQIEAAQILADLGVEGLVVIGGDGSYQGALKLTELGIACVGIPGTIDNDIRGTEFTIGFDTAINTVVEAIDKIKDTAISHDRTYVIEVMGRHCGDIAAWSGLATGADWVIMPNEKVIMSDLVAKLQKNYQNGKKHNIIVLAEGAGTAKDFGQQIRALTGFETKETILGHIQRGGTPSAFDRILATRLGSYAVDLLLEEKTGKAVGIEKNHLVNYGFAHALKLEHHDDKLDQLCKELA